MRSLSLFVLGTALCFPFLMEPAKAGLIETSSKVTEATIYSDRAMVTRTTRVHVPAGIHTISLTHMPAGLHEASLRVKGKANTPVKIGTVELKRQFLTEVNNAAEREKEVQLEAKRDQKAFLLGEIAAALTKHDFIERIATAGAIKQEPNNAAKLDFNPDQWVKAWGHLQTGMAEAQKDIASKKISLRKLEEEVSKLEQEMHQIRTQQAKERRDAYIAIEASAETDLDLSLTYQTGGASWQPIYDARLDSNNRTLDLEQYGQVTQLTGEDWANVSLTLSTAQPATGSEMPRLSEWWLRLFSPYANYATAARTKNSLGMLNMLSDSRSESALPAPMEVAAMDEKVEARQIASQAITSDYSAEFKVPAEVDLKSTRDTTKLYLGALTMKSELEVQTTPRLGKQAYLFAKATNPQEYPLIAGQVAKFRDGAFIGNAMLPMVRPNETVDFSFGADDRIKVDYKQTKTSQDNPLLVVVGDITAERHYQAKIQNLHKNPINVTVFDQYPVAADSDIKVTFMDDQTTPNFVKDPEERQGVIRWIVQIAPKEEKIFTTAFKVKYPRGKTVQGL